MQHSLLPTATISTEIIGFTCKFSDDTFPIDCLLYLQPNFCCPQCNLCPFTTPMLSFMSAVLNRLYSTSVFLYVLGLTRCRRQSNGPYWLSISQVSCPGLWRWRKAVLGSQHSVYSFRETPLLLFSHYPRALCLCKPPSQQHASALGQSSGIIEVVFIYLYIHTLVSLSL